MPDSDGGSHGFNYGKGNGNGNGNGNKNNGHLDLAKCIRIVFLGYKCEICGTEPAPIIMHHTAKDSDNHKLHFWWLCQLRCRKHERDLHKLYSDGNGPEALAILKKNNKIIFSCLEKIILKNVSREKVIVSKKIKKYDINRVLDYALETIADYNQNY